MRVVGVATGLGCSIVVALVLCIGGGVWLDRRLGTSPVLTFVGIALGLAAAAYQLWELANVGSKTGRPGPVSRQLNRLPLPDAARATRARTDPRTRDEDEE